MTAIPDQHALLREAKWHERAGRLPEAADAYERLLARWPDLPDSWYNLALLQRMLRRFDAALASYQQALDRNVSRPEEVHLNRGVIYSDYLRRDDAAARELAAALRLNPVYVPALANLANLESDLGRRDEATGALRKNPRHRPRIPRGARAIRGSRGRDDTGRSADRQAEARARGFAGKRARSKAALGFALGRAHDACGDYEAAFESYAAANRASRASAPVGAVLYDRRQQELLVDRLIAAFPTARTRTRSPRASLAPDLHLRNVPLGLDLDRAGAGRPFSK